MIRAPGIAALFLSWPGWKTLSVVLISAALANGLAPLALARQQETDPREASANALLQAAVNADEFSGVVMVAKGGLPVYRKAFGLANRELGVPNTPETKFRIASITKSFTAAAVMQLQEQGKLKADDPISFYYPGCPASWRAITIRQLLTHTSGLPDYTNLPGFQDRDVRLDRTPDETLNLIRDMPLDFEPGSRFSYSNTGYVLLGYIVSKVSGERYSDYVGKHILVPLGMRGSGYDSNAAIIPSRAQGYDRDATGFVNAPFWPFYADGGLYSTVDDLLRWDLALDNGVMFSPDSIAAMTTDYGHGYGFGWYVGRKFGHRRIGHGGGVPGFLSQIERFPDDQLTVIVLANETTAHSQRLAEGLAAIYLGIPPRHATPGGEAALGRMIEGMRTANVDYGAMTPHVADLTRSQLPLLHRVISGMGDLRRVTLIAADIGGADRYRVDFANGSLEFDIEMDEAGKLRDSAFFRVP